MRQETAERIFDAMQAGLVAHAKDQADQRFLEMYDRYSDWYNQPLYVSDTARRQAEQVAKHPLLERILDRETENAIAKEKEAEKARMPSTVKDDERSTMRRVMSETLVGSEQPPVRDDGGIGR